MKIENLLKNRLCDNCLGRQFAQLLTGYSNKYRGEILRNFIAMKLDKGENLEVNLNNFGEIKFHNIKVKPKKEDCFVCGGIFDDSISYVNRIKAKLKGIEFDTFLVGTRPSKRITQREEKLWEENGIDWTEPLKSDFNRAVGSILEREMKKKADFTRPDVSILIDLEKDEIDITINSVFIYGEYNKLIRGIPQTKWPSGKYKTSVEQIIAKDIVKKMRASGQRFSGAGREDIDAKCLGWRPFVLEVLNPKIRKIDLKKVTIGKDVQARKLKYTDNKMPEKVKDLDHDKTYRALTVFDKSVEEKDLKKISQLRGKIILQETPIRVKHRRADKIRKRRIKSITWKKISSKKVEFKIKAEAGTYIKELISGDKGRTYPSISQLLENKGICKELDVIKFDKKS